VTGIQNVVQANPGLVWEAELLEQAESLKTGVEEFKKKVAKYEKSLGEQRTRKKIKRIPREIQLALVGDIDE
jgi:hypothetical protein